MIYVQCKPCFTDLIDVDAVFVEHRRRDHGHLVSLKLFALSILMRKEPVHTLCELADSVGKARIC